MLQDVISRGEPISPGNGTAFVGYAGKELWAVTWQERLDAFGGRGTQDLVREFLLQVRPQRVVIWDGEQDDYVDLDPRSPHWPRAWTSVDGGPRPAPNASWRGGGRDGLGWVE